MEVSAMRATVMYGAGDVRIENVPDARLHLRQRPLAIHPDEARRREPRDGARGDRRRRRRRLRRPHNVPEGYRLMDERKVLKFQIKP